MIKIFNKSMIFDKSKILKWSLLSLTFIIFIILSVFFGIYDLEISKLVANPESPFGLNMEVLGELIGPYLFAFAGIIFIVYFSKDKIDASDCVFKSKSKSFVVLGYVFAVIGLGYNSYMLTKTNIFIAIGIVVATILALYFFIKAIKDKTQKQLYYYLEISIVIVIYLVLMLITINIFKVLWGRVRFRELKDFSQYTPFYLPQGINGNRSFPSGHTANAASLIVMTMFSPLLKNKFLKAGCYVIPVIWIIVMAMSRVLVGAHYCSDVLYASLISVSLFILTKKYILKKLNLKAID